jgi:hypothetical protein
VFAPVSPTAKAEMGICDIIEIYGKNYNIVSRVYGVLAMALFMSTILLYIATLHIVRKRYMKTFAFQMENMRTEGQNRTTSKSQTSSTVAATTSSVQTTNQSRRRKAFESLKVVGIILILFVVFTGPFVVYMFITVFNFHQTFIQLTIIGGLAGANSAMNPFVYSSRIDPLRNQFKKLFHKCIPRPTND